jgi:hypothetical protein
VAKTSYSERKWKVGFRRDVPPGFWTDTLVAYWEVENDPISDDYTPDEIDAADLFRQWAGLVGPRHPDRMIPIDWYISGPNSAKFESAPFQFGRVAGKDKDFLTHYHWPIDPTTGERLNWLLVPVTDKGWSTKKSSKGGFIQEATGWKPAMLQPHVYLPSLESALTR